MLMRVRCCVSFAEVQVCEVLLFPCVSLAGKAHMVPFHLACLNRGLTVSKFWHWAVCYALRNIYVMSCLRERLSRVCKNRLSCRTPLIMPSALLNVQLHSTTVAFEPLAGCMVLVRQWLAYAVDVAQVSVIVCIFILLNLHVITLSDFVLNLGKWIEVSDVNTVLFSVENGWFIYYLLMLMSLRIRDVAELEEMSFWKSDKILPHSVLLVCKQVERIACILQSVRDS